MALATDYSKSYGHVGPLLFPLETSDYVRQFQIVHELYTTPAVIAVGCPVNQSQASFGSVVA
jgi:hypothetical protein